MADEERARRTGAESEGLLELRTIVLVHEIGRRDRRHADPRGIEHEELQVGATAERHRVRRAVVADLVVRGFVAVLSRHHGPRVEEAPPSLARPVARFVVAANHDPRCGGKELARRLEEVRAPCVEAVTPRASVAAGMREVAGAFAVVDSRRRGSRDRVASAAAALATRSNGQAIGSSHDWKMPKFDTMRQPVSPRITTRVGAAFGNGNESPSTLARTAVAGIVASHVVTGKAEAFGGGRSPRRWPDGDRLGGHAHRHCDGCAVDLERGALRTCGDDARHGDAFRPQHDVLVIVVRRRRRRGHASGQRKRGRDRHCVLHRKSPQSILTAASAASAAVSARRIRGPTCAAAASRRAPRARVRDR